MKRLGVTRREELPAVLAGDVCPENCCRGHNRCGSHCFGGLFAPVLAPFDPNEADFYHLSQAPGDGHLLGTDAQGRDVLSRLLYGARVSLIVGVLAVCVACVLGSILGLCAAYFGGIVDALIMRANEAMRCVPSVVLAMALVTIFGKGVRNIAIILGISTLPGYILMMRLRRSVFRAPTMLWQAKIQGNGSVQLMLRHVLPNCLSPLIVMMTQSIGSTILAEAGLSFLGVGISIPTASWGTMVSEGKDVLLQNPVLGLLPGICVALLVTS